MERMGCQGRIMTFTESDSPPAWGILATMNFSEREMECVKWLNWMEADEEYQRRMFLAPFTPLSVRRVCGLWRWADGGSSPAG